MTVRWKQISFEIATFCSFSECQRLIPTNHCWFLCQWSMSSIFAMHRGTSLLLIWNGSEMKTDLFWNCKIPQLRPVPKAYSHQTMFKFNPTPWFMKINTGNTKRILKSDWLQAARRKLNVSFWFHSWSITQYHEQTERKCFAAGHCLLQQWKN